MAWIKLEHATPDKPEVALLARKLGVSQEAAFLNLVRVLIWADNNVVNGDVPHLSLDEGDTLARVTPGTFAALASPEIGWLNQREQGFSFTEWDRHNGQSAKHRAVEAAKKQRQRSAYPSCPDASGTNVPLESGPEKRRGEKIREEKNSSPVGDDATHRKRGSGDAATAQAVVDSWNKVEGVRHVRGIAGKRDAAIKARLADPDWRDNWQAALERVSRSSFCKGAGDQGWVAHLDWFVKPDTLTKIMEGQYDDRSHSRRHGAQNVSVPTGNSGPSDEERLFGPSGVCPPVA